MEDFAAFKQVRQEFALFSRPVNRAEQLQQFVAIAAVLLQSIFEGEMTRGAVAAHPSRIGGEKGKGRFPLMILDQVEKDAPGELKIGAVGVDKGFYRAVVRGDQVAKSMV